MKTLIRTFKDYDKNIGTAKLCF